MSLQKFLQTIEGIDPGKIYVENVRSIYQGHWREGDFVLHVPALQMEKRIEVLKNAKITR